jgi:hypothetical protein
MSKSLRIFIEAYILKKSTLIRREADMSGITQNKKKSDIYTQKMIRFVQDCDESIGIHYPIEK